MNLTTVENNLKEKGYRVKCFETASEAVKYLDGEIDGKSVGFGGSVTLGEIRLFETLKTHTSDCVGMAANMIGVSKRIIAINDNGQFFVMLNPEIIKCSGAFETEEGCLSLSGTRKTKRYKNIKVKFRNTLFQERIKTFSGWTAQIIQHEIDHCNGILI